ncbi:peptide MFS transporter [Phenylobacterium sp.]|uniref:peptide MFS transporter n=1 Tax=Phenylobacterium sp. TaxID=1871053 RepID=UPI002FC98C22
MRSNAAQRDVLGHPPGLTVLFLTETWEKFSYYGMRAILVYYMTETLLMTQRDASAIYGYYTAAAYLTPVIGGWIADRWLSRRTAVALGGSIMAIGHFMMTSEALFFPALAAIALGNGLFLPSLPAQIAGLYRPDDGRRMIAYNVYYAGINLGAFFAPLVCGGLGELLGWHWGFGVAGGGMVLALAIYLGGARWLPPAEPAHQERQAAATASSDTATPYLFLFGVILAVVIFRGAYEQIGNTVAVWTDSGVDRSVSAGFDIPMAWFQALNPLCVFLFTPLLALWWPTPSSVGPTVRRMALGALVVAGAYLTLAVAAAESRGDASSWLWLLAFFGVITLGELLILPVGLGLFGRLAPVHRAATMIAIWFVASAGGNLLGGQLGGLWSSLTPPLFFGLTAVVSICAALCLLALSRRPPAAAKDP